jgi:hypothetical protein
VRGRPGHWPAPVVDALEPLAASYAATFAAWGHRKLWALLQADGYNVSMSSVARALGRRGLLLPQRYQAELGSLMPHSRTRVSLFFGAVAELSFEDLISNKIDMGRRGLPAERRQVHDGPA